MAYRNVRPPINPAWPKNYCDLMARGWSEDSNVSLVFGIFSMANSFVSINLVTVKFQAIITRINQLYRFFTCSNMASHIFHHNSDAIYI